MSTKILRILAHPMKCHDCRMYHCGMYLKLFYDMSLVDIQKLSTGDPKNNLRFPKNKTIEYLYPNALKYFEIKINLKIKITELFTLM